MTQEPTPVDEPQPLNPSPFFREEVVEVEAPVEDIPVQAPAEEVPEVPVEEATAEEAPEEAPEEEQSANIE